MSLCGCVYKLGWALSFTNLLFWALSSLLANMVCASPVTTSKWVVLCAFCSFGCIMNVLTAHATRGDIDIQTLYNECTLLALDELRAQAIAERLGLFSIEIAQESRIINGVATKTSRTNDQVTGHIQDVSAGVKASGGNQVCSAYQSLLGESLSQSCERGGPATVTGLEVRYLLFSTLILP